MGCAQTGTLTSAARGILALWRGSRLSNRDVARLTGMTRRGANYMMETLFALFPSWWRMGNGWDGEKRMRNAQFPCPAIPCSGKYYRVSGGARRPRHPAVHALEGASTHEQ